jgi:hypothetical protein
VKDVRINFFDNVAIKTSNCLKIFFFLQIFIPIVTVNMLLINQQLNDFVNFENFMVLSIFAE